MLRLDGKVAIVTGCGSTGPGWGNCKAIAAQEIVVAGGITAATR